MTARTAAGDVARHEAAGTGRDGGGGEREAAAPDAATRRPLPQDVHCCGGRHRAQGGGGGGSERGHAAVVEIVAPADTWPRRTPAGECCRMGERRGHRTWNTTARRPKSRPRWPPRHQSSWERPLPKHVVAKTASTAVEVAGERRPEGDFLISKKNLFNVLFAAERPARRLSLPRGRGSQDGGHGRADGQGRGGWEAAAPDLHCCGVRHRAQGGGEVGEQQSLPRGHGTTAGLPVDVASQDARWGM